MRLILVASIIAAPAFAADTAATTLTVSGEPGWQMTCHVSSKGKDEYVRFLDKSSPSLNAGDVWRLACAYKSGSRGPITVTISSPTLGCPFKGAPETACASTLQKGHADSFEVQQKKRS